MVAFDILVGLASTLAILCGRVQSAVVVRADHGVCTDPIERSEWRTLDNDERAAYIAAVKCLQSQKAVKPEISAAVSRFEEFQALHIIYADRVHQVGHFLPWHRYFVTLYERALRDECGYEGSQPYWDWTQDADGDGIRASPIFDPETGFGGDGTGGTHPLPSGFVLSSPTGDPGFWQGCVTDGPFANQKVRLGPGKQNIEHCLVRGLNETYTRYMRSNAIERSMAKTTFEEFRLDLEGMIGMPDVKVHKAGHFAVGGDMCNFYSAPADPLFYLHHANIDRIWWDWQQKDSSRISDVSGRSTARPPHQNITLDYPLEMGTLAPTLPVRMFMDTLDEHSCYTYV